ncbi:TIGR02679 family protein [Carbonactinospora thermoautotrophica]|nr:TIGR02679 family protein [Carbonactinospora thermoautotrophica]
MPSGRPDHGGTRTRRPRKPRTCGDSHALDDGRRLATYVLRALACLYDEPPPANAEQRRALWRKAGLECDTLSASVLGAGLRPLGEGPLATTTRLWTAAGQATRLTLAQLRADPVAGIPHPQVWIVENPSVLAQALDRFGPGCPPLVCTSGWPNTAVIELLRQLRAAGAELRCHADFDGEGLRIAAYVVAKAGASPWRMTTRDYLSAVPAHGPSVGRVSEVPWDADLAAALRFKGVTVLEERVADSLLDDLDAA